MEEIFRLKFNIKGQNSIRLLGHEFYTKYKKRKNGNIVFKNKEEVLKEFFETKNIKKNNLIINIKFKGIICDKSGMFEDCESLIKVYHFIKYDNITKIKDPISSLSDEEDTLNSSSSSENSDISDKASEN